MNNTYFILRHGESIKNKKKIASCWPEVFYSPLTRKGIGQAKTVARKLKNIDLIFSSDLLRAKQTAGFAAKRFKLKLKLDKRLREINEGTFNGGPLKDVWNFWNRNGKLTAAQYYFKRHKEKAPKGESGVQTEKRLRSFINEIDKKYKGKNILIVSHQRPITLLEKVIYKYSLKKYINIIVNGKEIQTGEVRRIKK